jgi:hypothetical protein
MIEVKNYNIYVIIIIIIIIIIVMVWLSVLQPWINVPPRGGLLEDILGGEKN